MLDDYNTLLRQFYAKIDPESAVKHSIFNQLSQIETVTLAQVLAVQTDAQTVDIQPLVRQRAAGGSSASYPVVRGVPYFRLQAGANAIVIDPCVGDIGLCAFCHRDISNVIKNKAESDPATLRQYDVSDAIYLGGVLNAEPSQFVRIAADGVTIHSNSTVTINAAHTVINSDVTVNGQVTASGDLKAGNISLKSHRHGGVKGGLDMSGEPL